MHFMKYLDIKQLKWILLLIFPSGYFLTNQFFPIERVEFALYNILAAAFLVILLRVIDFSDKRFTAIYVVLILLLMGYLIRFYWVTIDPMPVERMLPWNPFRTMVANRDALFLSFQLSVIAFISFCFSVFLLLNIFKASSDVKIRHLQIDRSIEKTKIGRTFLFLTVLMLIITAYASYRYQIGEMGASAGDPLPFRLKGIIFYMRIVCIPIFILLCINFLDQANDIVGSRVGILILILNGVADMFLRSSRSSLLLALLLLVFLLLAGGLRLRVKEKVFLGLIAVLAFLMVPMMTEYRQIRLIQNLSHFDAVVVLFQKGESSWLLQFTQGLKFVLFRMPGIESLWCQIALGARPLGIYSIDIINSTNGIAGYLTYVIHPMKEANNTLLAPGFVGWFYLVGGTPAIITGSLLIGFITTVIWNLLDSIFINTSAAAKVFLLWMLFLALTEGTLDSMSFMMIAGIAALIFMEILSRLFFSNSAKE